jgi:hypothetical protein
LGDSVAAWSKFLISPDVSLSGVSVGEVMDGSVKTCPRESCTLLSIMAAGVEGSGDADGGGGFDVCRAGVADTEEETGVDSGTFITVASAMTMTMIVAGRKNFQLNIKKR